MAAILSTAMLSGCGSAGRESAPSTSTGGHLTVFAAASLKTAFTGIGERFETENPGTSVDFSFAGSSDLVTQLTQGAPADVFASADTANMDKAAAAGLLDGAPADFASNTLTIIVAPGNPLHIRSFQDLAQPGSSVVICAPPVPCGAATDRVEQAAGVRLSPVSEEVSVTDVLNKVATGQADAGVVYVSDVAAAGDKVTEVAFPEAAGVVNTYPIAVLEQTGSAELAHRFIDLVTGESGQQELADTGFTPVNPPNR